MEQRSARIRWLWLLATAAFWIVAVLARLSYLQLYRYSDYLARAQRQQQRVIPVTPKRGILYDRNGHELAMSVAMDAAYADPADVSDTHMVAQLVSRVVGASPDEIEARLADSKHFARLASRITPEQAARIDALGLRGVYTGKENHRFYPHHSLAAHVIGYVDVDEHGIAGIEYSLDKEIRFRPGHMLVVSDGRQRWVENTDPGADQGANVVLALDENIQYIVEKELAATIARTHARSGVIIVQDPNSGDILALASWPTFDLNSPAAVPDDAHMDRAITAAYEPGSTFKLITMAAAISEGVARPEEVVDCQMGSILVAGRLIHDWHPFGQLTVAGILAHSSDVGAIKIALRLGAPRFYQYIRALGFGQPTGIELPGENRGIVRRVENWGASSIGSLAMGQEISANSLQIITAVSATANGGTLYRPRVVREIRRGDAVQLAGTPEGKHVLDGRTAATLRQMMEGVILEGTGRQAALNGYSVAGKSGTAQKIDPATGRYSRTQYVASFVGFAPVNNPVVSVLVTLDSPVGPHHGGDVSGPAFRRIAEQVLAYLDVPHDLPVIPEAQWAARHRKETEVSESESDFQFAQAETVDVKKPSPDVAPGPAPTVAFSDGRSISVPQLTGQTVRSVTESCSRLGLTPVLVGTGIAVEQSPPAGTQVPRGTRITVRFGRSVSLLPAASEVGERRVQ